MNKFLFGIATILATGISTFADVDSSVLDNDQEAWIVVYSTKDPSVFPREVFSFGSGGIVTFVNTPEGEKLFWDVVNKNRINISDSVLDEQYEPSAISKEKILTEVECARGSQNQEEYSDCSTWTGNDKFVLACFEHPATFSKVLAFGNGIVAIANHYDDESTLCPTSALQRRQML